MKINILARPDHSHKLFEQLQALKGDDDSVNLYTFYCLALGSFASKLFPKLRVAPEGSHTLDLYTFTARTTMILLKYINVNHRQFEADLLEALAPWNDIEECDVLHYWPFYCARKIKELKSNANFRTVVEYYEAEPSFVNSIYTTEYEKFGLKAGSFGNLLINQNLALEFEKHAIVASDFTARSYRSKYPDVNFHVCSYGPAGFRLAPSSNRMKRFSTVVRILYVGQVSLEKGVPYLMEATSHLNVSLDLVGPIKDAQKSIFSNLLSKHHKCNYIGSKRNSEVLELIAAYDIFCLPSLSDNYSLAVVEALSRGLPVVVTENCGNADDVRKFNLGAVSKVCDVESLVHAISNLTTDFDTDLFNLGLEKFFSKDNVQAYPKAVMDVYKTILSEQS